VEAPLAAVEEEIIREVVGLEEEEAPLQEVLLGEVMAPVVVAIRSMTTMAPEDTAALHQDLIMAVPDLTMMISLALLDHISIIMAALAQEMMIALLAWLDAILQLGVQVIRSHPNLPILPKMMMMTMTDHPSLLSPTSTISIMMTTTTM